MLTAWNIVQHVVQQSAVHMGMQQSRALHRQCLTHSFCGVTLQDMYAYPEWCVHLSGQLPYRLSCPSQHCAKTEPEAELLRYATYCEGMRCPSRMLT
jgi:hypothetical protein